MSRIAHCLNVLRNQEEKGKFLLSRLLWYTGLGRFFRIRREGFVMRFYPSGLSVKLWQFPDLMRTEEDFIGGYLRAGDAMIDIGANVGLMTLRGGVEVGDEGRVVSFEPHPRVFGYLEGNVKLNGLSNVVCHNVALGNTSEESIALHTSKTDDMSQISEEGDGIAVSLARLDDYAGELPGTIDLLKIDVEGYEKFVFEGGKEVLARTQCILFEAFDEHYGNFDYGSPEVFACLAAEGFSIYRWRGDVITAVSMSERIETLDNLLAVRDVEDLVERTGYRLG